MLRRASLILALAAAACTHLALAAPPQDFVAAKEALRRYVDYDQENSQQGDFYCGCHWQWVGKSGGRVDPEACGYRPVRSAERAARTEVEHVLPISILGRQRQCWQNGGRQNCERTDPVFNLMEGDLYNLQIAVGDTNLARSDFNYGMVPNLPLSESMGSCRSKVSSLLRVFEPRDEVKGAAARTTMYMAWRYGLRLSEKQQKLLMAWNDQHPVTAWELERSKRIARIMGHTNPFVTGERHWQLGDQPVTEGLNQHGLAAGIRQSLSPSLAGLAEKAKTALTGSVETNSTAAVGVVGNKNSGVYHLSVGCPGYGTISPRNRVEFTSEAQAQASGYRKAKNCL